jgi:hypothetical protein
LLEKSDDALVIGVPGTNYRIQLRPTVPGSAIATAIGKRILGRVRGKAQRMHAARAGGRFIEPVYGHPRIVNGTVLEVDAAQSRVLVDMVIPAWLTLAEGQAPADLIRGQTVNMYVESGMTFEPLG